MNKKKNIKRLIICLIISFLSFIILFLSFLLFNLTPLSKSNKNILFEVKSGLSSSTIIENLKDRDLIRNELVGKIYFKFNNKYIFKAGTYQLRRNMSLKDIFKYISNSKNNIDNLGIKVTIPEGKRITHIAKIIDKNFNITKEEFINTVNDEAYIRELMTKYWFLTDEVFNGNIYYSLEGYLFPDTYRFDESSTVKDMIKTMLDNTGSKLETVKTEIQNSGYSVHQILSMSSIIELEGVTESDRKIISQVIYKRLRLNMALGMDVTTYYAVKKEMNETLYVSNFNTENAYNTRGPNMAGKLPVGPICNPSLMSIKSALNPANTDYLYFYADIKTGKVYFSRTLSEQEKIIKEVG